MDRQVQPLVRPSLTTEELIDRRPNVSRDLSEESLRSVAPCVKRNRGPTTVGMTALPVRSTLTHFNKAMAPEESLHVARLEYRDGSHVQATRSV